MAEMNYRDFEAYLNSQPKEGFKAVYLIHGEEYLYKSAFDALLNQLVPLSQRSFAYEPVDEDSEGMPDIIERLNTFSLMSGAKVVALCDSRIFYSKQDQAAVLKKIKGVFDKGDKKKAAIMMGSLLSMCQISLDEALTEKGRDDLKYSESFDDDGAFLKELVTFIGEHGIALKTEDDPARLLKAAMDKGFPEQHHLVITTDLVDKRKSLYTAIKEIGLVVDCSVPKGDRKADKESQEQILKQAMGKILEKGGKTMEPAAFTYLCDMTGFDIRTFSSNLEKLIAYAGDRAKISLGDAKQLLQRSKQDPIYELSGAIAERNLQNALFYTQSLLANGIFPLQILATVANQLRRLLLAKDFVLSLPRGKWKSGMDYNSFRTSIMPLIKEYDQRTSRGVEARENLLAVPPAGGKKEKKIKIDTDLIVAKNPNNPYPVYLLVMNSERYSLDELYTAVETSCKADIRLKSTGENPKLVLEDLVIRICRPRETVKL